MLIGALLATAALRTRPEPELAAQERGRPAITQTAPRAMRVVRPAEAEAAAKPSELRVVALDASVEDFTSEERVNIAVYDKVNRSVVNITTRAARADAFFMFEVPSEGSGSGSVLDKHGHILTNYHVIAGAREMAVTLYNGETYDATLVGLDPLNDIAVLRIAAPDDTLFPVLLGDSTRLRVGQKIYAIGNPFGLERTMTVGIISSLNRSLPARSGRTMKSIIQIDAALNRGNSGGPLLNSRGELVGMNTAIASSTGENTGVGFAIPVATIVRVVPQLIENGRVIRPDIGIMRVYQTESGLVIATLTPGGPAERAGLRGFRVVRNQRRNGGFLVEETRVDRSYADTIVAIDGKRVTSADEFLTIIEAKKPGDEVVVSVVREGRETEISVTLGAGE
jgi:S1-C subfamily serine protease